MWCDVDAECWLQLRLPHKSCIERNEWRERMRRGKCTTEEYCSRNFNDVVPQGTHKVVDMKSMCQVCPVVLELNVFVTYCSYCTQEC